MAHLNKLEDGQRSAHHAQKCPEVDLVDQLGTSVRVCTLACSLLVTLE
jgi:hypothetical protein